MRRTIAFLLASVAMLLLLPLLGAVLDGIWAVVVTAAAAAAGAAGTFSAAAVASAGDVDRLVGAAIGGAAALLALGLAAYARLLLVPVSVAHAGVERPRPTPLAEVVPLPVRRLATPDRRSA